jgi:uncharacterized membrane protein YedE/YeeE
MFESLGFETLTAPQVSLIFALILGAAFGLFAEQTKFCFRRAVIGNDRKQAAGIWMTALAVAIAATQTAVYFEIIDFSDHRFLAPDAPLFAAAIGGALFGAGMVLSRGCASRLTVLTGTGNMRALVTLLIFGLAANATMKGPLADLRIALTERTTDLGDAASLANVMPFAPIFAVLLLLWFGVTSGNRIRHLIMAAAIGTLPAIAWVGTGFVLYDDFDPIAFESLAFTLPAADTVFWIVASTSVSAKFTVGLLVGVIAGAFVSALLSRRLNWVGFDGPAQMGRYSLAAVLMGFGGVTAGGCTIGAGLSGIPTLSIAAVTTLVFIALGAKLTHHLVDVIPSSREFGELNTKRPIQPAE